MILHTGYDLPERERKQKAERNIILLRKELQRLLIVFLQKADLSDNVNKTFVPVKPEYDEKQCVNKILSINWKQEDDLQTRYSMRSNCHIFCISWEKDIIWLEIMQRRVSIFPVHYLLI